MPAAADGLSGACAPWPIAPCSRIGPSDVAEADLDAAKAAALAATAPPAMALPAMAGPDMAPALTGAAPGIWRVATAVASSPADVSGALAAPAAPRAGIAATALEGRWVMFAASGAPAEPEVRP